MTLINGDLRSIGSFYSGIGYRAIGRIDVDSVHFIENLLVIPRKLVVDIDLFRPSSNFLVAFKPGKKQDARRAGKVRRASTLLFDESNIDLCDEEQIEVMRRGSAAIEILISALLNNKALPRFFSRVSRCVKLAAEEGIDILFSSGARELAEAWAPGSIRILCSMIDRRLGNIAFSWVEVVRRWRPGLNIY